MKILYMHASQDTRNNLHARKRRTGGGMPLSAPMDRKHQVAQQLRALMDRHGVEFMELAAKSEKIHGRESVDNVTIRRIAKAEAKTEPKVAILRKLAEAVGEDYETAFPETGSGPTVAEVEIDGRRYALKKIGAGPPTAEMVTSVKKFLETHTVDDAERTAEIKKATAKPRPKARKD